MPGKEPWVVLGAQSTQEPPVVYAYFHASVGRWQHLNPSNQAKEVGDLDIILDQGPAKLGSHPRRVTD